MKITAIFSFTLFIFLNNVNAQTSWTGIVSTNWKNSANWTSGVPTATVDAIIGDANFTGTFQPVLTGGTAACKSLTIGTGSIVSSLSITKNITVSGNLLIGPNGSILHNTSGFTLTVKGNWTNTGAYTASVSTVAVTFSGGAQTISGSTTFSGVNINTGSTVTLASNITINTQLTLSGTLDPTSIYTISGTGGLTCNSGSILFVKAATFASNYLLSGTITLSGTSTINYNSAVLTQDISSSFSYGYLRISGGSTKYLTANLPSLNSGSGNSGRIYIDAGILDMQTYTANRGTAVNGGFFILASNSKLRIGGTNGFPSNFSTITPALTSTIEYYGNNQTVANLSYGNLLFQSTTGIGIKSMPSSPMVIAGNWTSLIGTGAGVSFTAGNNITVNRAISFDGSTTFDGGSYTHIFKGNWSNDGIFSGATSTVTFSGLSAILSGTGTNNFFNIKFTAANISSSSVTNINVAGNVTTSGSGNFTQAAGGNFLMTGSSKSIIGNGFRPYNLTLSGSISTSGNINVSGDLEISGSLSASSPSKWKMIGASKTIFGSGSTIFFKLDITGTISTTSNFTMLSSLTVAGTGSFLATAGAMTVNGTVDLSGIANLFNVVVNNGKTLRMGSSSILGISNVFTKNGTLNVTTNVPNTVSYNGGGNQTIVNTTYNNLKAETGGTKTPSAGITVNNDFTIGTLVTFSAGTYTHVVGRHFTNSGTFSCGTSTIQFTGSNVANITGSTTFNNLTVNKSSSTISVNLRNAIFTNNLTMTAGNMQTGIYSVSISGTRTGNGIIIGTITHNHSFVSGTTYYFEGPQNSITFTSPSAGLTSVTVTVAVAAVADFNSGQECVNREYIISIPAGTYTNATLRLHYEDNELNAYSEPFIGLYKFNTGTSVWDSSGYTTKSTATNYVEQSGLTSITSRWTFSGIRNVVRWNGSVSSAWENASNWTTISGSSMLNRIPASTDMAEIGSVGFAFQPTINSTQTINNINFCSAQNATLTINSGSLTTIGGIKGLWTADASDIIDVASGSLTVGTNLDLSNGVNNREISLIIGSGTATVNYSINQSATGNITFSGNGNLLIGANYNYIAGNFSCGVGTVSYFGTESQVIAPVTYNNLIIAKTTETASINSPVVIGGNCSIITGGQLDINNTLTIAGNFSIGNGTTVVENDQVINIGGNWSNAGLFTVGNGTVNFNGIIDQSVDANTFNNLIVNKSSSTLNLTNDIIVNSDLTISSGVLDLGNYSADRSVSGGILTLGNSGGLKLSGASNFPENYNLILPGLTSTIEYNGTSVQDIASIDYGNLTLSNGGSNAKLMLGDIQVNGNLLINTGSTFDPDSNSIYLYGNFTNSGTFLPAGSTLILNGVSKTFTGNTTLYDLNVVLGSYVVSSGTISMAGDLFVDATGSMNFGTSTISLDGDLTNKGSLTSNGAVTFTGLRTQTFQLTNALISSSTGIINFNGTISPIFNSTTSPTFATININNTGGISPSVPWTVYFSCTIGSGSTFNGGAHIHIFYGNFSNNGTVTSSGELRFLPITPFSNGATLQLDGAGSFTSTGKVEFGGTRLISLVHANPVFNLVYITNINAAGVTPVSDWNIPQELFIGPGAALNGGSSLNHTIAGNFTNNGSLSGQTSTFIFTGSPTALNGLGATSFYNLTIASAADFSLNKSISIQRDLSVNGNFNTVGRTISFTGSSPSVISGSVSVVLFDDLEQNKTGSTTTLSKPSTVTGDFLLTDGIVNTTATNLLTLTDNATSTGGTATSFVSGPMKKIGDDAFIFPLGKGVSWARLGISTPNQTTDEFTAEYFASPFSNTSSMASVPTPALNRVSTVEYWNCERTTGTSNVTVELYWESAARSGIISYGTDLSVAHWNGVSWENYGQSAILGASPGRITSNAAISFNQFTFGSQGMNPLPIDLIGFTAKLNPSGIVDLKWETASEVNNDYFVIERSDKGVDFDMIEIIYGGGNSSVLLNYSTKDSDPLIGTSYYRLKQVDFDGKYKYSDIESIERWKSSTFIVYPNPNDGTVFNISFSENRSEEYLFTLVDSRGQVVLTENIVRSELENSIKITPMVKLNPGVYLFSCRGRNLLTEQKVVVK